MKILRYKGNVIQYNDDYLILKFDKGTISFEGKGELYVNFSEIEMQINKDGTIPYSETRYPFLIDRGTKRKTVFNYMLGTVLMWDDWALKKELNELIGVEWK